MGQDLLVIKKEKYKDQIKFLITEKSRNSYAPRKYENVMYNKDYNHLANIFFDLNTMGYPIHKAYKKFRSYERNPKDWFL